MPDIPLFLLAAVLLTLAPGPDNVQVVLRGITQGRIAALTAACGFASGIVIHTALAACGVALLIRSSPRLFAAMQYAGAGYLFFLGYRTLRHRRFLLPTKVHNGAHDGADRWTTCATGPAWAVFRQSFVANVLNPKVTLFFLSFLPQFVRMDAGSVAWQMTFLGLVFMLQAFVIFAAMGWFAASLGQRLRDNQKFGGRLNTLAGLVFIGIGLKLALSA